MDTEKTCGTITEENPAEKTTIVDFSTSFLTRLAQLAADEDDEEHRHEHDEGEVVDDPVGHALVSRFRSSPDLAARSRSELRNPKGH